VSIWMLAILILLVVGFLFWKLTAPYSRKQAGNKMWKLWSTRLYYWQTVIYASTGITVLVLFILKWTHVVTF
jgi:hypothetical protein